MQAGEPALTFLFAVHAGYSRSGDFKDGFVGAADQKTGVAHRRNHAHNASGRHYPVAGFQSGDGGLEFALFLLLRSYQEEIEDPEDEDHRQEKTKTACTALEEK